jgi:hypothetical protein
VDDPVELLRPHCAAVGFDLGEAESSLLERMRLVADGSKTFDDALRMAGFAHRIFRHYEKTKPEKAFTSSEKSTVVLAALFSDIGKTGPAEADTAARRYVVDVFAVENVKDDRQSLDAFMHTYFPKDADTRISAFKALGIEPSISIRQFWNLHSGWTLAILEKAGVPPEAVAAAATHHLLDDVNPGAIVGEDDRFTRRFGENASFDRAEKLVIVLDKYDAARRRGRLTHEAAIAWIEERIAKSKRFHDDAELKELVADVKVVLAE